MVTTKLVLGAAGAALLLGSTAIGAALAMPRTSTADQQAQSSIVHNVQSKKERERRERERESAARCQDRPTSATGSQRPTENGAKASASRAWQDKVRNRFGEKFIEIANAKDAKFECSQSARALGVKLRRCELYAIPCQPKAQ